MNAPDLDDFLVGKRTGSCRICIDVAKEHRDKIAERVKPTAQNPKGIHAWKAFAQYLVACGYTGITKNHVAYHFGEAKCDG